ncbi:MAG TPA: hypothetical protein VHM92_11765 [Allosphingosinicella sp.]|nr:hypothetical protein [Allosphingosinicella sp.]
MFFSFIADLFRGGPNPFLGSPIAADVDRRQKIEKQARLIGTAGGKEGADALVAGVDVGLTRPWQESLARADAELDQLDLHLAEEEDFLENCRPRAIRANLEKRLGKILNDVSGELGPLASNEAKRRIALDHFMADHHLERTTYWGKRLTANSIYLMIGITLFEFVLNTLFFSGTQRSGMIGGAGLAMLLSVVTIVLGIGLGIAFQNSGVNARGGGWFGRAGAIALLAAMIFYLLLLTLARVAGEAGDTKMFVTAAREIQVHPFSGLLDLPALAYCFFTIGVVALVYSKFIGTMGHFPGLRGHRLDLNSAEEEFDDIQRGLIEAARSQVDQALDALDAAPGLIQMTTRAIAELTMNYENVVDQLRSDMKEIQDAARLLVGVVQLHTGRYEGGAAVSLDYASPVTAAELRLKDFKERAERLEAWEEINTATIEKCGEQMTAIGKEKLAEIELRCEEVRQERYRDLGGIAPPVQPAGNNNESVAWLPRMAS